ncbi:MAG: UbiD family decarboxylase [Nitrospinota bacterium]
MAQGLRTFLSDIEANFPGDTVRVEREVEPRFEPPAFIVRLERQGRFPVVFFEQVRGSELPVVMNVHAQRRYLAAALGVDEQDFLEEYIRRETARIPPVMVETGPVKEFIQRGEDVDVTALPVITHNALDDAPYITMGVAITKNPVTGKRNVGLYRNRLIARNRIGLYYSWGKHIQYFHKAREEEGRPLDVAIVIGMHPALYMGSQSIRSAAWDEDECELVGGLLGEPLELVKCETVDLEVPAQAEIVIEGRLLPEVRSREGPFGEYSGYYGQEVDVPEVEVTAVTRRADAIYEDCATGASEHVLLAAAPLEGSLLRQLRTVAPTVSQVHIPSAGVLYLAFVSMKKVNEGDAKNVLLTALGMNHFLTLAVAVDEDVNVFDPRQVLWAVATRTQGDKDIFVVPYARGNRLDPMTYNTVRNQRDGMVTKVGIDATQPIDLPYELPKRLSNPLVDLVDLGDVHSWKGLEEALRARLEMPQRSR